MAHRCVHVQYVTALYCTIYTSLSSKCICGPQHVDIALLRRCTEYGSEADRSIGVESPEVQIFWDALESFDEAQRQAFLRFVWGRSRLPRRAADFQQPFNIRRMPLAAEAEAKAEAGEEEGKREDGTRGPGAAGDRESKQQQQQQQLPLLLPKAFTCFFRLDLPGYISVEQCSRSLLYAQVGACLSVFQSEVERFTAFRPAQRPHSL